MSVRPNASSVGVPSSGSERGPNRRATEVLARYEVPLGPALHLLTLGSTLTLATVQSPRVERALARLLANPHVISWCDCYSDYDWMCDRSPVPLEPAPPAKYVPVRLTTYAPFLHRLSGETHQSYFHEEEVFERLLA